MVLKGEPGLGGIMKYVLQLNYSDTNSLTPIECPTVRIESSTNELELVKTPQFKVLLKTVSPSDTSGANLRDYMHFRLTINLGVPTIPSVSIIC